MSYKYHYIGEQAIELPAHHINTEGNDKDFVYETTEPINHPDFISVDEQTTEEPHTEEATTEPEQPVEELSTSEAPPIEIPQEAHQEEVQQTENVSEGEATQVE